ncbi:MAG: glycosyltransferase [archaeon]|nr:glycosyltransferase [archaeon]
MAKKKDIPKISLVVPVYNMEKFLEDTLDSIRNQTFKDFELIIVENGSTDSSLKILKEYSKKDKRFILKIRKDPDAVGSANEGLKFARGKYICKIDADDIYLPNKLKVQYEYLEKHPKIFLVGSSAEIIGEGGEKIGVFKKFNNPKKIRKKLMKSNPFIHSSIMYYNLKELFYREKFIISEDYDLYLRLLTEKKIMTNLPDILMKYRIRRGSLMATRPNQRAFFDKAKEFYLQRKKYGKEDYENFNPFSWKKEKQDFRKLYLGARILAKFQDNQMENVRREIKDYFKIYGLNKHYAIYYILSFFPKSFIKFLREKIF